MADVESVIGARIRITTKEGSYEGTVHSLDQRNRKLTLTKVVLCSSGKKLHGFHNFFGDELNDLHVIEQETISPKKNIERPVAKGTKELNPTLVKAPTLSAVQRSDLSSRGSSNLGVSQPVERGHGKAGFGRGRGLLDKALADAGITYKPGTDKKLKHTRVTRDVSDGEISLLPREPVTPSKYLDSHFDDGQDDDDILINDDGAALQDPPQVILLDTFGNKFENAIKFISSQRVIGVCCEGVNLGRFGKLCLLVVGCRQFIYLFDVVSLGSSSFDEGLTDILEDGNILKVFHDCRQPSDILFHQYGVQLVNVFDTQVADVLIYRNEMGGEMPRCVNALVPCLYEYLNLSSEQCHFQKIRKKYMQNDEAIWEKRPLPEKLLNATAKHVMYLRDLRVAQMERLMAEFLFGVDIYLRVVRDAAPSRKQSKPQFLPPEFKKLDGFKVRHKRRPYDTEYSDGVPSGCTSNSVWNDGAQFAEKYQNKPGRFKEHVYDEFDESLAIKALENFQSASDSENSEKGTVIEPVVDDSSVPITKQHHGSNGIDIDGKQQLYNGTERYSNSLTNENIKTRANEFSISPYSAMENRGNASGENALQGDQMRQNYHQVPSTGLKNSNVEIKKPNGRSVMNSGSRAARAIFSESDFPPLNSSDSECGTTPPRQTSQRPSNNKETAKSPISRQILNTKMLPQPPRSFAGVEYSGPIGRGRAQNLLSHMTQPPARLPAEDKPVDFRTLKMRGVKFSFPEDHELLATSEVVPVSDAGSVSGTRVRLRET